MGLGSTARKPFGQQIAFLRQRLTRAGGVAQTLTMGIIPAGSNILRVTTSTRVAFDGTTPVFSLGILGSLVGIAASAANGLATLGSTVVTLVAGLQSVPDVDETILATFSVTAGTVGTADIQIEYSVPDETP